MLRFYLEGNGMNAIIRDMRQKGRGLRSVLLGQSLRRSGGFNRSIFLFLYFPFE